MYSFYDYMPNMAYGGAPKRKGSTFSGNLFYQTGGSAPERIDYPDEMSWQDAMSKWISSQRSAQGTIPTAANVPTMFSNKFKLNPYVGVSVADFLATQNKAADYASRKELAKSLGISNYRGTANQNAQLMQMIQDNPDILTGYGDFSGYGVPTVKGRQASPLGSSDVPYYLQAPQDQGVDPWQYFRDNQQQVPTAAAPAPIVDQAGNVISPTSPGSTTGGIYGGDIAAAGSAVALAATLGGYHLWQEMRDKSFDKNKVLNAIKNRGFRQPDDMAKLIKSGMKPNEATEALKGYKFQKGYAAEALQNIENEVTSHALNKGKDLAKQAYTTYKTRFKTAKPVLEEIQKTGVRQANTLQQLREAGLTQQEAMEALKGIKFAPETAKPLGLGTRMAEGLKNVVEGNKFLKGAGEFLKGFGEMVHKDGGPVGYYDGGGQWGGTFIPEYGQFAYGGYHSEIPRLFNQPVDRPNKAMYGMGMAQGGQMPQWLAERRFTAAGNRDQMADYGYEQGGEYNVGDEIEVTPEELEMLKQQGYKFKITG